MNLMRFRYFMDIILSYSASYKVATLSGFTLFAKSVYAHLMYDIILFPQRKQNTK